jgi:hypothetical protein
MMDYRQPLEPAVVVLGVAGALSLGRAKARKPALGQALVSQAR